MARRKAGQSAEVHRCESCGTPVPLSEESKKIEALKKRRAQLEDELGRVINELAMLGAL